MKSVQQHRARPRIEEFLEPRVISIASPGDSSTKPACREAMSESELREALAEHHDSAYGWALHCCGGRRDEAMDILHSAYVKTLDGRAVYSGRSTFRTWLFGVIRNTALDQQRSVLRRLKLLRDAFWRDRDDVQPVDVIEGERSAAVRSALGELTDRQRSVLHLVFYQDMSVEEAGSVLEISVGSARTHYHRGKEKLRSLPSDFGGDYLERAG